MALLLTGLRSLFARSDDVGRASADSFRLQVSCLVFGVRVSTVEYPMITGGYIRRVLSVEPSHRSLNFPSV